MTRRRRWLRLVPLAIATLASAGASVAWYAASDDLPHTFSTTLLESIMPAYDVQEIHSTYVEATPARAHAAILAVTADDVAMARMFMWVRTAPARLIGGAPMNEAAWRRPLLPASSAAVIGHVPDRAIIVGLIGRFWKLGAPERIAVRSREHFVRFDTPGFAVSTLSFHIDCEGSGSRVTTITRVRTTDTRSRRAFLRYWRVIGTGSAILRRTWLRAVKERAERLP